MIIQQLDKIRTIPVKMCGVIKENEHPHRSVEYTLGLIKVFRLHAMNKYGFDKYKFSC